MMSIKQNVAPATPGVMTTTGWHRRLFPRVCNTHDARSAVLYPDDSGRARVSIPQRRSYPVLTNADVHRLGSTGSAGVLGRGTLVGTISVRQDGLLRRAILTTEEHGAELDLDLPPNEVMDRVGYRVAVHGNVDMVTDGVGRMSRPIRVMWGETNLSDAVLGQVARASDVKAAGGGTLEGRLRIKVIGHETQVSLETQRYQTEDAPEVLFKVQNANPRRLRHLDGIAVQVTGSIDKFEPHAGTIDDASVERIELEFIKVGEFRDFSGRLELSLGPHRYPAFTLDEAIMVDGQRVEKLYFASNDTNFTIGDKTLFGEVGPVGPQGFAELRGVSHQDALRFDENGFGDRPVIPLCNGEGGGLRLVLDGGRAREVVFGRRNLDSNDDPTFLRFTGRVFRYTKSFGTLGDNLQPRVLGGVRTLNGERLVTLLRKDPSPSELGVLWAHHEESGVIYGLKTHRVGSDIYATPDSVIMLGRRRLGG